MPFLDLLKNLKQKTKKEAKILVLGLDNAGKTTLLKQLSKEEISNTEPTQGFNISDNFKLNVWDLGGQKVIRQYWQYYFEKVDAIVYVVDSSDEERIKECNEQFNEIINDERLVKTPVLVYANKQDLLGLSADDVLEILGLNSINDRYWAIHACSALKGEGIQEGMEWLMNIIANE